MTTTDEPVVGLSVAKVFDTLGYRPHSGQRLIHANAARHRVAACGRRFGKSVVGGHELSVEALRTKLELGRLHEAGIRNEFWIVGPEYTDSEKEFRVFWNDLVRTGARDYFDKPGTYNNPESGDMVVSMFGGKFLVHAKSAKYPQTLVGEGLRGVVMAEAAKLKRSVWSKYIRPTLADFQGWSLWLSTPEGKNHFYEAWQRGQDPAQTTWQSWRMPSWRNPVVFPLGKDDPEIAEMAAEVGGYDSAAFQQEIAAEFSEFVGRVFKDFDEEVHVRDLKYDPKLPLYGACDYGWTNPFVWLVIQVDVWDNVYVLGEYRVTERDITEIAKDLAEWAPARNCVQFYPEPASPGDTAILAKALRAKAMPDTGGELSWRLALIRKHLKPQPEHLEDGHPEKQPKLFIDRRCTGLIQEMSDYRYPENKSELRPNKEEPLDKDDHGPEALGRFFRGYFGGPTAGGTKGRGKVTRAKVTR